VSRFSLETTVVKKKWFFCAVSAIGAVDFFARASFLLATHACISIPALMLQEILDSIPHRPPFLFVDGVVEKHPDGITCVRTLRADESFYKGHYPDYPITPGVLLCEAVFQAGAVFLSQKIAAENGSTAGKTPVLSRIEEAKFKNMVFPGDTITIDVRLGEKLQNFFFMSGKILKEGKTVLTIRFALALVDKN
jgi:3-hydroxyacyl-[acyl-carrier-protein] dehydratase